MAAKGQSLVTFADIAKHKNPNQKIAEVLIKKNPILKDIPYIEMNEGIIHKETIRSFIPKPVYRKANEGLAAQKSLTQERTFTAAHFESRSQVEKSVAQRGGMDKVAWNRFVQAEGHIQGMANEHADLLLYGSPSGAGDKNLGLADIYYSLSGVETSKQIANAGGTGSLNNTSIYMINWGIQTVFGVYPGGTQAGLKRTDYSAGNKLVQLQLPDASGSASTYYGYDEIFELDHGLVVKDFRHASRIANINVDNLIAGSIDSADLIDLLITGQFKLEDNSNTVIYCNRTVAAILHKQARKEVKGGGGLTYMNYGGEEVLSFNGMPIRVCDSILNTEAAIV